MHHLFQTLPCPSYTFSDGLLYYSWESTHKIPDRSALHTTPKRKRKKKGHVDVNIQSKERKETKHFHYKAVKGGTLIHWPQLSLPSLAETVRSDSASQHY